MFFDDLSTPALTAVATLSFMGLVVALLVLFFRHLGTVQQETNPGSKGQNPDGVFGFPLSQGEEVTMEVLQVRKLSPSIKNFRLKPPEGQYVHYQPGQFLTFHVGENQEISRCYSLNTTPSRPGLYEVSVKLLEGGKGSTWMHTKVKVGDKLKVTNPSGRFVYKQMAKQSIFVAGGIGVTPMLSMLKWSVDLGDTRPLFFFYATRNQEDLVFLEELEILAVRAPNVTLMPILSDPSEGWKGKTGRINAEMMLEAGVVFQDAELYTCGPGPMMDAVKDLAVKNGMPADRFYNEVFTSPTSVDMETRQAEIKLAKSGKTLDYNSNLPLLDFCESQNVEIPFSCRAGVCGNCEVKVNQGKVYALPSDFLDEEDKKEGKCLTCITYPLEDLELDL